MSVRADLVRRDDVPVLFVGASDEVADIRRAWEQLETTIGSLRGRKFIGVFDPEASEYRACVERQDTDDSNASGLVEGTVHGGLYLRTRLKGEPPEIYDRIAPTFDELRRIVQPEPGRSSLELYRRRDVIDLLMPVIDRAGT